jgi:hypothetical protein
VTAQDAPGVVADDHPDMVKAICRLLILDCDVGTVGTAALLKRQRLQPDGRR